MLLASNDEQEHFFFPPKQKHQTFGKEFASWVVMRLISFFLRTLVSCQNTEFRPTQTGCIYRGPNEEENRINFSSLVQQMMANNYQVNAM